MKSDSSSDVTRDELTNLTFGLGYSLHYRYLRSKILENDIDRIDKILSNLKEKQIEKRQIRSITNNTPNCTPMKKTSE